MKGALTLSAYGYVGKVPSRGDFIKGGSNAAVVAELDEWLTQAMGLMCADARWRLRYDAIAPMDFVIMGPRQPHAIAGCIAPSSDLAARRYPFMTIGCVDGCAPAAFVPHAPLLLGGLWRRLGAFSAAVTGAADATALLQDAGSQIGAHVLPACGSDGAFDQFLGQQRLGTLEPLLHQSGHGGQLRQLLLALGLLLQPVRESCSSRLDKCLLLPLPDDPAQRELVAAFWMHVIAPFLDRADFELALFLVRIAQRPLLVLGFNGASPQTLHTVMDPLAACEHHIGFDDLDWVGQAVGETRAARALSDCLSQPSLSLQGALAALHAAFTGS